MSAGRWQPACSAQRSCAATGAAATERTLTWTSRADFEQNAPGRPGPTTRFTLDAASLPDSLTLAVLRGAPDTPAGPALRIAAGVKPPQEPALIALPKRKEYLALRVDLRKGQPTVIAQRLDAKAAPLGKPVPFGSGEARQSSPSAALDEQSGSVLVAWIDYRALGTAIYALPAGARYQLPAFLEDVAKRGNTEEDPN